MNERLEEIKTRFNAMKELESFKKLAPTDLFFDDLNWLLQQAEQNQRYKQALEAILTTDDFEDILDYIDRIITIAAEALKGDKP